MWARKWVSALADSSLTFRTRFVDIPPDVLTYLERGSFVVPSSHVPVFSDDRPGSPLSELEEEPGPDENRPDPTLDPSEATFPEFERELDAAISQVGGECFPKTNWSAPRDSAHWLSVDGTLSCRRPCEVMLLLKASDMVADDLAKCRESGESPCVVVKEYKTGGVRHCGEWRCAVVGGRVRQVTQRHAGERFEWIAAGDRSGAHRAARFVQDVVAPRLRPLCESCVVDVAESDQGGCLVVDVSEVGHHGPKPSPMLGRTWEELSSWGGVGYEVFVVEQAPGGVVPSAECVYGLPEDIVNSKDNADLDDFLRSVERAERALRKREGADGPK